MAVHNPALLSCVADKTLNLNYTLYIAGVNAASAAFSRVLGDRSTWAVTAQFVNYGTMKETTSENIITGTFSAKDMALVFQNFNLFPQYTALQNITLAGELLAKEKPEYKANRKAIHAELEEKARALLAQMGLSERENHYPHQLSGGQQQRVAIARALALEPDILCFDEPTSALDPELTGEVLRVLRDLADQKTTMIIVTHEMSFARDVADRILFMDGGVVVEEGPAHQVIEHPHEERTKQFLSHYGT